jgi:uncharacterized integral membrane protein
VPRAGAMWLRIEMRRRHEMAARSRRWLLAGQFATIAIAIVLVLSFFRTDVQHAFAAVRWQWPLVIALAGWFVAAPLAGFVAVRQK